MKKIILALLAISLFASCNQVEKNSTQSTKLKTGTISVSGKNSYIIIDGDTLDKKRVSFVDTHNTISISTSADNSPAVIGGNVTINYK